MNFYEVLEMSSESGKPYEFWPILRTEFDTYEEAEEAIERLLKDYPCKKLSIQKVFRGD